MLTASSKRWWKKQGDWRDAKSAVDGVLPEIFKSDRSAERYCEGVLLCCWWNSASFDDKARLDKDDDKESDR